MLINYTTSGKVLTVQVSGGIADEDIQELKLVLEKILNQAFDEAVFDFSQLQFMCSASIGRLMLFYKNIRLSGRHMRVKGMTDYLFSLFEFTNLNLLFPIER